MAVFIHLFYFSNLRAVIQTESEKLLTNVHFVGSSTYDHHGRWWPSACQSSMTRLWRMNKWSRSLHAQLTTELPLCAA
ncbi:hypothetical protein CY34DRAFT_158047 [Suillus luteus UH-Slu-Lm8-n1]|uniref:Uncharacterized protein n=1 Tax=Suillus luteus UH-Slu-Lm8-n1 TaxID=930992 RepID=A0A0C9ZWL9_9AGAM|nr:hypothetical protein CY34DRAFT_158047 [Suillus luteus UH-Slu-Lm8-n1]